MLKKKTTEEIIAGIEHRAAVRQKQIETKARIREVMHKHRPMKTMRITTGAAILLIKVSDTALLFAFLGMCLVAYALDMIFFFQQSPILWLALLFGFFGLVIRTIAINGGVVLQWVKLDQKAAPAPITGKGWQADLHRLARFLQRNVHLSRSTLRVITVVCWVACAYASVSFFSSGHELRQFEQESITTAETTTTASKTERIDRIKDDQQKLRDDKVDIRADRDKLIAGARESMRQVLTDKDASNDDLSTFERNVQRYNTDADTKLAEKDAAIAKFDDDIKALEQGKEEAKTGAVKERAANPPFLAVYKFVSDVTGWEVNGFTIWSALFFAFVIELVVDTGLGAWFRTHEFFGHVIRDLTLKERQRALEWDIDQFNLESAAKIARSKAEALAQEQAALQKLELAAVWRNTRRAELKAQAAADGKPFVDPFTEIDAETEKLEAEARARITRIKRDAAEAERRANEPPPTDTETRNRKGGQSSRFQNEANNLESLLVMTDDRQAAGAGP